MRAQFVVPMLFAILAVALLITFFSKWYSDRKASAASLERLQRTGALCANANYPLTSSVLTQIEALSSIPVAVFHFPNDLDDPSTFKVEQASQGFPSDIAREKLRAICQEASSSKIPLIVGVVSPAQNWNAHAQKLSTPEQNASRFIVMLERIDMSNREKYQAFLLPLITGLCSLAAMFIVATALASKTGVRIESLKRHVARIAQGDFTPIQITGPVDDIHSLNVSINSMSEQLRDSTQKMAATERSRLINLIASGIAHELRNHLTGARLAIQTCDFDSESQEAISIALKQLRLAEESVQRLLSMRGDTKDSSAGSMPVQDVINSAIELTMPIAKHHRTKLQIVNDQGLPVSKTENLIPPKAQLEHGNEVVGALINLILNGIQASGVSGSIELSAGIVSNSAAAMEDPMSHSGTFVEIVVRDNGPGPSKEIADSLFEPFTTTKPEGIGLGLANCKRVAQMHGGSIRWRRKDNWTEFVMTLKLT